MLRISGSTIGKVVGFWKPTTGHSRLRSCPAPFWRVYIPPPPSGTSPGCQPSGLASVKTRISRRSLAIVAGFFVSARSSIARANPSVPSRSSPWMSPLK